MNNAATKESEMSETTHVGVYYEEVGGNRGRVVDPKTGESIVLPTWSDAELVAEAIGGIQGSDLPADQWPTILDSGWVSALERIRGPEFAQDWQAARMGPHTGPDARARAIEAFFLRYPF